MDSINCKPSSVKNIVGRAFQANRPIFIWGPPGIGKSDIVDGITRELGNSLLIDLRLALMEPTDIRGYPFRNPETNTMEWAPPTDLPDAKLASQYDNIVLFLDELNSAPPSVQAAAYQLILNRKIGQYNLPDNVLMVAAGNRETDRGVTYRMPAPLANRFRHVNMMVDFDDWQTWALNNGIHRDVLGYLNSAKGNLFNFNPKNSGQAFATPRSWAFVSDILKVPEFENAPEIEQIAEVAGAIGDGMVTEFMAHRKVSAYLPKVDDILAGKVKDLHENVKDEISAKFSLVVGITYELNDMVKANDNKLNDDIRKKFNNAVRFSYDNFEAEIVVLMFKTIWREYKLPINVRTDFDKDLYDIFAKRYTAYIV